KKFRVQKSGGKIMATVFWDGEGIIMVDYLEKGKTVSGEYYAMLLGQLRERLKQIRRGKLRKGVLLLQTMRRFTTAMLRRSPWLIAGTNCSPTLPILQTWLPLT